MTLVVRGGVAKAAATVDRLGCETIKAGEACGAQGKAGARPSSWPFREASHIEAFADRQAVRMLEIAQQADELRIESVRSY